MNGNKSLETEVWNELVAHLPGAWVATPREQHRYEDVGVIRFTNLVDGQETEVNISHQWLMEHGVNALTAKKIINMALSHIGVNH